MSNNALQDGAALTSWVDDGVVEPTGNQVLLSLALPLQQQQHMQHPTMV
jgi:hypothetical protein